MVDISVIFSINGSDEEKESLHIDRASIDEFLGTGFADNIYDGTVSFKCMPRSFDPDLMQIIIYAKEAGECIIAWGTIIYSIVRFVKRCKGYSAITIIKYEYENGQKKEFEVDLNRAEEIIENELKDKK